MYIEVVGDMLASSVEGELVGIPVNCIGVAGKGLAAYMKFHLPDTTRLYYKACKRARISTGELTVGNEHEKWWALLPTKYDWRSDSDVGLIDVSLSRLVEYMDANLHPVVKLPQLGCGVNTGGLNYEVMVKPLILKHFEHSHLTAIVYDGTR